ARSHCFFLNSAPPYRALHPFPTRRSSDLTRGADLELDEQHASSLMQVIEEETKRRPFGAAVRVEVEGDMPQAVRELLLRELQFEDTAPAGSLGPSDLYAAPSLVDLGGLRDLA